MYTLVLSMRFKRASLKFLKRHPELEKRLAQVLHNLEQDPFQPQLRLHPLKGQLSEYHAISVTYNYRIVLTLKITEHEIILLDIGSHDQVYQ